MPNERFASDRLVGRGRFLRLLERFLQDRPAVAIVGPPGVGKTSIALEYASLNVDRFPNIIHVGAGGTATEGTGKSPAMLIFDDMENWGERTTKLNETRARVISGNGGRALFVGTRRSQWLSRRIPSLELAPLSQAKVKQLISNRASRYGSARYGETTYPLDEVDSRAVWKASGGNPRRALQLLEALNRDLVGPGDLADAVGPFSQPGILGPNGRAVDPGNAAAVPVIQLTNVVNLELIAKLDGNPELLYGLHPRGFEELVAELLKQKGYGITLTPTSRDGGKDIYAARKDDIGSFLYLVECKRYAPDRPVGVHLVRALYGTVQAEKATAGILATTSYFTSDAVAFQGSVRNQLSLQDYIGVQAWIRDVAKRGRFG